jgi:hypothetical protein
MGALLEPSGIALDEAIEVSVRAKRTPRRLVLSD